MSNPATVTSTAHRRDRDVRERRDDGNRGQRVSVPRGDGTRVAHPQRRDTGAVDAPQPLVAGCDREGENDTQQCVQHRHGEGRERCEDREHQRAPAEDVCHRPRRSVAR